MGTGRMQREGGARLRMGTVSIKIAVGPRAGAALELPAVEIDDTVLVLAVGLLVDMAMTVLRILF
jgi:hypothetical protein